MFSFFLYNVPLFHTMMNFHGNLKLNIITIIIIIMRIIRSRVKKSTSIYNGKTWGMLHSYNIPPEYRDDRKKGSEIVGIVPLISASAHPTQQPTLNAKFCER